MSDGVEVTASKCQHAIGSLVEMLMDVETTLSDFLATDPSPEDAAKVLLTLHEAKSFTSDAYSIFSARVTALLESASVTDMDIDGNKIEVRTASDRKKWVHSTLASAVAKRLMDMSIDMDTGEVLLSPQEIANKMLDYVQPSYWRVKELAKIGINADQYCEVGEYKTNIIIRKAK